MKGLWRVKGIVTVCMFKFITIGPMKKLDRQFARQFVDVHGPVR